MFDFIKIIFYALTGAFRENKDLRKGFWAFLFVSALSVTALTYNSFMSYNFYLDWLDRMDYSSLAALSVTIAISTGIFFVMAYVSGYAIDLWRYGRSEYSREGVVLAALILVLTIGWDVYANLQGVDPVSHISTETIMTNPLSEIDNRYQDRIEKTKSDYSENISQHQQAIGKIKKYLGSKSHNCNKVACEKGYHRGKRGNPHWKGAITPYGANVIESHTKSIQDLEELKKQDVQKIASNKDIEYTAARDDYDRDKYRYDNQVQRKQVAHRSIVKFVYLLAFLFSLFAAFYLDEATHYIMFLKESGELNKSTTLFARYHTYSQRNKAKASAISYAHDNQKEHNHIGFQQKSHPEGNKTSTTTHYKQWKEHEKEEPYPQDQNFDKFPKELRDLLNFLIRKEIDDSLPANLEVNVHQLKQDEGNKEVNVPLNQSSAPGKHKQRSDGRENMMLVKAAYFNLAKQGIRPSAKIIYENWPGPKTERLSLKSIGTHLRDLKKRGEVPYDWKQISS